jgi:ribosomal protein S18 acetylase RimI-like enzyme
MPMQQPDIRIRAADLSDAMLLAEIGRRTFRDTFGPANSPEDMEKYLAHSFGEVIQTSELKDPDNSFLVAEISGDPVGYVRLRAGAAPSVVSGSHPMEIVRFYSVKDWIGRGVGPRLMQASLELATHTGHDVLWLDVWERNDRAIAFYKKWRFEVVGNQPFVLGDDLQNDLLMARQTIRSEA